MRAKSLYNKLLIRIRAFRLAHCAELRFAPSRVNGISLLNRQRATSAKLQLHHCFRHSELMLQTSCDSCGSWRVIAKRQAPRIAFKAKGSILLLDLADIVAVQAEGNYVSLQHRPNPYLVHESLSSMAEKLKPYGFIRIHRSVVVNISAVEEIQPLPTGEYRLRVKGGKEYLVTRTYKHNLRDLAQLWVGSERLCG